MESTAQMIDAGLTVTFIGMSVVFTLLTALVGIINAMSALCRRFAPEPVPLRTADTDEELIGVIAAAVHRYRRSRLP